MKKLLSLLIVAFFVSTGLSNVLAQENKQTNLDTSYKIYTHTVVGSNDPGSKTKLSNNLSKALENVRDNFSYANYRLLSTQFQLIKDKGSIEYKSVLKDFELANDSAIPVFAEWSYRNFGENKVSGKNKVSFGFFQFVLRFPFTNSTINNESESKKILNYENIQLTSRNIDFMVGEPTVFASLPIEYSDKTLFFVAHIEEAK